MSDRTSKFLYPYAGAVATLGIVLAGINLRHGLDPSIVSSPRFWMLVCAVIAGEFVSIKIPHHNETLTVTVGDPFTLSLLFTFGLAPALLVKLLASALEDLHRRQPWWKILFNTGQFALSLTVCFIFLDQMGYRAGLPESLAARELFAALGAGVAYFALNAAIVTSAISMAIGASPMAGFRTNVRERFLQYGALLGFAPVVTQVIQQSPILFPLLLIPVIIVYANGMVTQKHVVLAKQLTELYETTRITNTKVETRDSVKELLTRVCKMFDSTGADIVFFAREGEDSAFETLIDLDKGLFRYMEPVRLDPTEGLWARAAAENRALMLADPIDNPRLRAHFASLGIKDVMISPMHEEEAVNGVIRVFNRRGDSQTFSAEDLRLFETLANHASIAMENARLIAQLEDSLAHLTEMNQLKDDFVASVSHELRTPLTSIRGYVKTLLRPDANFGEEDRRMFLETVDRQSNRLHRLIEDLLAVSRIESEGDPSAMTMLSLRPLAEEVADELRGKAEGHTIDVRVPQDLPLVQTDASKVHQIVSNLVDNALKYSPEGTTVAVVGAPAAGGVTVSVTDHGPGIPADLQDKIFDRFYQVDQSATRKVGGTGLGLYICKRMAEAIGGRVWLEKSDEEGSTFSLWIPSSIPLAPRRALADSHN